MVANAGGQGSLIGATIGGYQVEALIGRGAMGAVYLARDVKLNRLVALKVLLGSLARTPSQVKEFLKEAHTAAPLNHPGIVRIYSAGVEGGTPYIAMEFVDGEPLDRFMKRKGALKWDVALQIARKLSNALDSAHKSGVVHRDIKPSNIMLDRHGGVRLTDFGIAAAQSDETAKVQGQDFLGTPQYMSPEQARGQEVTTSSDLYSLGVTLYEMINGDLPFKAESSMALINAICNDDAVRLNVINPDVPDDVARFVAYLMGKTPKDRPANAKVAYSMIDRLQKLKGELSTLSESLTSFLQDEMEVRPFQSLHQPAAKAEKKPKPAKLPEERERHARNLAVGMRVAAVVVAGFVAFVIGFSLPGDAAIDTTESIPTLGQLTSRDLGGGTQVIQYSGSSHGFHDVQWLGGRRSLWLETRGPVGTRAQGAVGVIGLDTASVTAQAIAAPVGPSLDPDEDVVYRTSLERATLTTMRSEDDSVDAFLIAATDRSANEVVVLTRPWQQQFADPLVRLRVPYDDWVWGDSRDALGQEYGHAVLSPGGEAAAFVLYDRELGFSYVVEQTRSDDGTWLLGEARTSQGNEIIPESLRYSADGTQIFYMRRSSVGGGELWMLPAAGEILNGQRVRGGVIASEYSVSHDGNLVALNVPTASGDESRLDVVVLHAQTGTEYATIPNSRVGRDAFHADGQWIVVNRYRTAPVPQLRAVSISEPDSRVPLTTLANGMTERYAFSADGRTLAAIPRNPSIPSVLLIDWAAAMERRQ